MDKKLSLGEIPILEFKTPEPWETWLEKHHQTSTGIWMRFYKKASKVQSITYAEALDVALCYGWIDSLVKKYDDLSYIQKFGPRKSKSVWSKINTGHIERLIKAGRMKPAGMQQVESAKKDGRWSNAYDSSRTMTMPKEFLSELSKHKKAQAFFETLNKTNTYAIAWRIQTAKKEETKVKRIKDIIAMLEKNEKFY